MSYKKIDFIVTLYAYYKGVLHAVKAHETRNMYIIDWNRGYDQDTRMAFSCREHYSKELDRVFLTPRQAFDFYFQRLKDEQEYMTIQLDEIRQSLDLMENNRP